MAGPMLKPQSAENLALTRSSRMDGRRREGKKEGRKERGREGGGGRRKEGRKSLSGKGGTLL